MGQEEGWKNCKICGRLCKNRTNWGVFGLPFGYPIVWDPICSDECKVIWNGGTPVRFGRRWKRQSITTLCIIGALLFIAFWKFFICLGLVCAAVWLLWKYCTPIKNAGYTVWNKITAGHRKPAEENSVTDTTSAVPEEQEKNI